jgi:quinol monooxygenase YgiN
MSPVFAIRTIDVAPADFERLYGEIASFMNDGGRTLPGCLEQQLFGSEDRTRIVIVAEFRSQKDWCRAQWDARLGELLEEIVTNAGTIDFNLYERNRFLAESVAAR